MKKVFAELALKAVAHPVQLFTPNDRAFNKFGELIVDECLEIIKTSENLDEACETIKKKFDQKA